MFGNKSIKEQLQKAQEMGNQSREMLDQVSVDSSDIQVEIDQLNMSANRLDHSLTKVVDCTKEARDCHEDISDKLSEMQDVTGNLESQGKLVTDAYTSQVEFVSKQKEQLTGLIEDGKNYTSLSKSVSQLSKNQEESLIALMAEITGIRTVVNNIGAMALDAAIEAGRMGETGINFVKAAENIRQATNDFGEKTEALQMELQKLQNVHQESEQEMNKFIALVKDNNKTASTLLNAAEKNEKQDRPDAKGLSDYLNQLMELQNDIIDINTNSKKKQETILDEMESIGACYMEQQDSTARIETSINHMKQVLSDTENTDQGE